MLVLLPPSEGKSAPDGGSPVDLDTLAPVSLARPRRRVLGALVRASRRRDRLEVLRVGPSLAAEVARNRDLLTAPTAPARTVYTGVLYEAAGLDRLPDDVARDRAERTVRTVSALWGVVGPAQSIPAYRLSMGVDLPGVGPLARFWREPLRRELDPWAAEHLVVDCRSSSYAAAWPVPTTGPGHVAVRVLSESDGVRTVVSHWAKHARGLLTRHLVTRPGAEPSTPAELRDAARELVGASLLDVELAEPKPGRWVLSLVTPGLGG